MMGPNKSFKFSLKYKAVNIQVLDSVVKYLIFKLDL